MGCDIVTLCAGDNYIHCCIHGDEMAVVDAADAATVIGLCEARCLSLRLILSTHHHHDHTGGNARLKSMTGCLVAGGDKRTSGVDRVVRDGEHLVEGPFDFECIAVPGHTRDSLAFHLAESGALFTGDTLFYGGCGRLFEGTAPQLYRSLGKLLSLPDATSVFCGHEYTLENLKFARLVEPENRAVVERTVAAGLQLQRCGIYGPATLALESATNPFLRTGSAAIRRSLGLAEAPDETVFGELRRRKDLF